MTINHVKALSLVVLTSAVSFASTGGAHCGTGFYVGLQGGAGFSQTDVNVDPSTQNLSVADRGFLSVYDGALYNAAGAGAAGAVPTADQKAQAFKSASAGARIARTIGVNGIKSKSGKANVQGAFVAGYQYVYQCFVFGVEAFGGYDGTNYNPLEKGADYGYKVKRGFNYGANFILGYFINPNTQIHVKVGMDGGQYKYSQNLGTGLLSAAGPTGANGSLVGSYRAGVGAVNTDVNLLNIDANNSNGGAATPLAEKKSGSINFALGGGMRTFITKNVFVGLDYMYVFGKNVKLDATGSDTAATIAANNPRVANDGNYNPGATLKTSQHKVLVSIGYKF